MKNNIIEKIGCIIILLLVSTFAVLDIAIIYGDLFNNPQIGSKASSILKILSFNS
jgi:hypothetical protein